MAWRIAVGTGVFQMNKYTILNILRWLSFQGWQCICLFFVVVHLFLRSFVLLHVFTGMYE